MLSRSRFQLKPTPLFSSFFSTQPFDPPPRVPQRRVVVTGLGMVTPLGCGVETTWKRLIEGSCGIREITIDDLRMNGFIRDTQMYTFDQLTSKVAAVVPCGTNAGEFNQDLWLNTKGLSRFEEEFTCLVELECLFSQVMSDSEHTTFCNPLGSMVGEEQRHFKDVKAPMEEVVLGIKGGPCFWYKVQKETRGIPFGHFIYRWGSIVSFSCWHCGTSHPISLHLDK